MSETALDFRGVTKAYGDTVALSDVSLKINTKEKVALLGCNGAGKSSLLSIATGLSLPSSGDVQIMGHSPLDFVSKEKYSFLPQVLKFPSFLKVKDVIGVVNDHFPTPVQNEIFDRLGLMGLMEHYCHSLSGGEERKLAFALSLFGHRKFLILDEPTANVDLLSKREVYSLLADYVEKDFGALLFSSHEMGEVEQLADRIIVLNKGRIVAEGTVDEIKRTFSPMKVVFHCSKKDVAFKSALKMEVRDDLYTLWGEDGDEMIRELVGQNTPFQNLKIEQSGLEEVFVKLWSQS